MTDKKYVDLFVCGRLCLFGEHSDWAGTGRTQNASIVPGHAIVTGTNQGIYARACKSETFAIKNQTNDCVNDSFECPMEIMALNQTAKQGGYFSYAAGVASYICEWYSVGGVHIEITKMDLPMKKGLSSSASICVLVAQAFNMLYHLKLNIPGIMNIAYLGEQRTPSRCGRLDQACAYGAHPVSMVFDGNEIKTERLLAGKPLYYVFADLCAQKDTVKILSNLNSAYPFPKNERERTLHEALGHDNEVIVEKAIQYIASGDAASLGLLMTEAQAVFDRKVAPMCPEQLTAPVLHKVLNDSQVKELTYGGKGVGSQGDGTVQFLAKDEDTQKRLIHYLQDSCGMVAYPLTLCPEKMVRKAIIPIAGYGTRLFPETRFVKKEMCPVVDADGLVKPVLLVLLEELDRIGIEEICLVISAEDEKYYNELLMKPLSPKHYEKLPAKMKAYEKKYSQLLKKIRFVMQREAKGFGHAVLQAATFAEHEPVLLLLGDTIYQSFTAESCIQQVVKTYEKIGKPIVGLQKVLPEDVSSYGIFSGKWEDAEERIMKCDTVVEKPTVDYAREFLCGQRKNENDICFAAFGIYVLTKEIFESLGFELAQGNTNANGEIDMTAAFASEIEKESLYGYLVDGESFDLGNATAYRNTVSVYGKASDA